MKLLVAAAIAAIAVPAFAQDMAPGTPPPPPPQTTPMPPPAPMPPTTPMPDPAMPAPTTPAPDPGTPMPMAAPAPMPMAAPDAPPPTTDGNYPMCSRTVTDHCTERSNARGERLRSTPRG